MTKQIVGGGNGRASSRCVRLVILAIALAALNALAMPVRAIAAEPIKIGFSMALTGAYAGNGKAALLATQMWANDQNARGGLLGRPVQLVNYDDQSNPSLVPGIYTKLFDIDKVDLVISGYGTNIIGPAMPLVMQHNKVFMSLAGLRVNEQFHYNKYFQIFPFGPKADITFAQGFFDVAMWMNRSPDIVYIPRPSACELYGATAMASDPSGCPARRTGTVRSLAELPGLVGAT